MAKYQTVEYVHISVKIITPMNEIQIDTLCKDLAECAADFARSGARGCDLPRYRVDSDDLDFQGDETDDFDEVNGALVPIIKGGKIYVMALVEDGLKHDFVNGISYLANSYHQKISSYEFEECDDVG